jgi:hypothetical protein
MPGRRRMTTLEAYAQHGSVSYGEIGAARLSEILRGARPDADERASVVQALTEMPGSSAHDLAAELGMTYASLNDRAVTLCGRGLPA